MWKSKRCGGGGHTLLPIHYTIGWVSYKCSSVHNGGVEARGREIGCFPAFASKTNTHTHSGGGAKWETRTKDGDGSAHAAAKMVASNMTGKER